MSKRLRQKAEEVRRAGEENSRGQDTLLAHITEDEAEILRLLGGSGKRDPETGLLHFYDGDGTTDSAADESAGSLGGWSGDPGESPDSPTAGDPQDQYSGGYAPGSFTGPQDPSYEGPNPFNEEDATQGWGLGGRGDMGRGNPDLSPSDPTSGLQSSWSIGLQNFLAENGIYTGAPTTQATNIEAGKDITGPANFGGVGSRGGVVDNVGAFLSENPYIDTALSVLLGLANPAIGIGYNALSNIARGNYGLGIGGLVGLANPAAGRTASLIGSVIDKGPEGALTAAYNELSSKTGFNPGMALTDALGLDPSSRGGTISTVAGNLGAQQGLGSLGAALGSSWSGLGLGEGTAGFADNPDGGGEGMASIASLSPDAMSPSSAFAQSSGGGSVGMEDQRKRLRDIIGAYSPASNMSKYLSARQQRMLMEQQNG